MALTQKLETQNTDSYSEYRHQTEVGKETETASKTIGETATPLHAEIPTDARFVRPDELLAALATIEDRTGEVAVYSLPLGEALAKVGATVPAEAVWQEIQYQRNQQHQNDTLQQIQQRQRRQRIVQVGTILGAVGITAIALRVLFGDMNTLTTPPPPALSQKEWEELKAAQTISSPQIMVSSGGAIQYKAPNAIPLSKFPINQPMWISLMDVGNLQQMMYASSFSKPLSSQQLSAFTFAPQPRLSDWVTIHKNGKFYICGWFNGRPGVTKAELLATPFTMYNRKDHPDLIAGTIMPIQVPFHGFNGMKSESKDGQFSVIRTSLQHLDGEAFEPWAEPNLPESSGGQYSLGRGASSVPNAGNP